MTSWHSLLACAQADVTLERIASLAATSGTERLTVDFKEKATRGSPSARKVWASIVGSAVSTSKFCHFLLPRVFPVIDNAALGASGKIYEAYFRRVQDEWAETDAAARDALIAELTQAIETRGRALSPGFPLVNKIVELRLIGRHHAR